MTRYHSFLIIVFAAVWTWAAIDPKYPHDWLLENYLVFVFVPLILLTARYFRLSRLSYTLITAFLALHVVGSHYTYAEAPFGYALQRWFDAERNMYDRLVHFAFGLLLAYLVAAMPSATGEHYYLEIMLPGAAVGLIVGWATQRYGRDQRAVA